ncbi:hypothetical protein IHE45_17G097200 [Dioscorea alata]|uniref:Uncharacterized protein n=1 Tax=Dioscorea alata TaxID=55571 RepID=A0ACB7UE98_DIOAL|nr:hypothetical protein IHE45_17G097200 [Dioscorea alata]
MEACKSMARIKPEKLGCMAVLACLLVVPIIILALPNITSQSLDIMSLHLPIREAHVPLSTMNESKDSYKPPDAEISILTLEAEGIEEESNINADIDTVVFTDASNEIKLRQNYTKNDAIDTAVLADDSNEQKQQQNYTRNETKMIDLILDSNEKKQEANNMRKDMGEKGEKGLPLTAKENEEKTSTKEGLIPQSSITCDFSGRRSDICYIHGDVRVLGNVILSASSSQLDSPNTTWQIRPYARKWETNVMGYIKEISLRSLENFKENVHCAINHSVPAVVFSTGGFLGNFFHDFTDVLIPLFTTARQYHGEVQFLVTDFNAKWINKYQLILQKLSRYEIINIDTDTRVHCFQNMNVGLQSDKVMGIDPSKSPNGYSMADFREFIRESLSLERRYTKMIAAQSRRKPRLLILLRKGLDP